SVVSRLRQTLISGAQPAGGWGYYEGKGGRIEPTSWALLALEASWEGDRASWTRFAEPHVRFLARCQRRDGLLSETSQSLTNFTAEGTAAVALAHLKPETSASLPRLLNGIALVKGVKLGQGDPKQDG